MSIVYYGGLDVHQKTIVAFFFCPETGDCWEEGVPNDRVHLLRAVSRWRRRGELRVCYEASGAGFVLKRWLDEVDVPCDVVASAFIPRGPGDRVKTDRRDARNLAQLYAAGLLRTVRVPSEEEETVRALVRHRDDLTRDMTRMKNRILKFLGLLGLRYTEGKNWTKRHRQWLHDLHLGTLQGIVLQDHLANLEELERQRAEVDRKIAEIAEMPPYREPVQRLMCLRGIALYSAMAIVTELGDATRFRGASAVMSYLGLVPREHSSGDRRRNGGITKVGNRRGRWVLIEAARNQSRPPARNARLQKQRKTQPEAVVALAVKAEERLHRKFWKIAVRKDRNTAAVAVAREMAGFVWALMTMEVA
ncbi:MAG: IS110 family transposase [Anaerolineales bacterium]